VRGLLIEDKSKDMRSDVHGMGRSWGKRKARYFSSVSAWRCRRRRRRRPQRRTRHSN
jgi:hypothetical protein